MAQIQELVQTFLKDPTRLRYSQIEKLLLHFGFIKIRARGSHVKFKHKQVRFDLIIPVHNNECKQFYKKLASRQVKENNLHILSN